MSFLEKYKPKTIKDLYGNKLLIKKATDWIRNFAQEEKKLLLLCGPPGIGKTSLAQLLLNENNYSYVEFNASDVRSSKILSEKLNKIINNTNILSLIKKNCKMSIIMDEIDSGTDRGSLKQLISCIESTKTTVKKNKKFVYNLKTPIICCCNNDKQKSIKNLKKYASTLYFTKPTKGIYSDFITKICKLENIKMDEKYFKYVITHCQNDFRRILTILEFIQQKNNNQVIKRKQIKEAISILSLKTINRNIFEQVNQIFYEKCDFEKIQELSNFDSFTIPLIIHQNIISFFKNNLQKNEPKKIKLLQNYYKTVIQAFQLEQYCFEKHNWEYFIDYINTFSSFNTNLLFSKIPKTIYQKYRNIQFSTLLSKTSLGFLNSKNMNELCKKLKINFKQFQLLSETILQSASYLKESKNNAEDNETQQTEYNKLVTFLKHHKINKKDFDKIIKLNYYQPYWNKKITKVIKKQLFQDVNDST